MSGDGHRTDAAALPNAVPHVLLSSRNQTPKGHGRGVVIPAVSPQQSDAHITAARPASAAAYPQPLAKQHRPASAAVHQRPAAPAGSGAASNPSMSPAKAAVRPMSAAGSLGPSNNATMARLKAELAGLASIGNVQLQSLRPSTPAVADIKRADACSELEAKVLCGLESLEQQLNLTYTQARQQPASSPAALESGAAALGKASDVLSSYTAAEGQQQNSQPQPPLEPSPRTTDNTSKQQPVFGNKDALSAFLAVLQGETGYNEEQAKAEIEQMRLWVAEQDIRLLEPSVAAKFSNKAVAARISQLLSENQVLQYQHHHYESALAELREDPTYGSNARWKHQQQAALLAAFEAEAAAAAESADDLGVPQSPGKSPRKSPKKQRLHHGMDAAYFLAKLTGPNSASNLKAHASTAHLDSILAQATSFASSFESSNSDDTDAEGETISDSSRPSSPSDNKQQLQQEPSGIEADVQSQHKQLEPQSKHRKHLSAVKSAAITAAEDAEEAGIQQKPGYTGSTAVVGRANLSRCISRSSDVLQLSHIGLRPHQLYKVSTALTEAPWIKRIDLSGNLLTDQAVAGLVDLLLSIPSAVIVTHLDLSQNHMLTWRCCAVLSGLLSQQQQQISQPDSSRSNATSANTTTSDSSSSQRSSVVSTAAALLASGGASADSLNESDTFFAEEGTTAGSSNSTAAAEQAPQRQPQQMQFLQMVCVSLAGVGIGDKGAAALAGALASNSSLQVLHLARCGLHDPGGAAICLAVRQHPALREVDLSWNALGHNTARAVEAAFRCPTCLLSWLSLSHCGLDDRDGARILDALTPASFKLSYCSVSGGNVAPGTSTSKDGCTLRSNWVLLDLSHNSLEGGAALCAAAVIEAFAEAGGLGTCSSLPQQQQQQQQAAAGKMGDQTGSSSFGSRNAACRILLLDGNPLGVSGVRCIARALAGQPSVGLLPHTEGSNSGTVGNGTTRLTAAGSYHPSEPLLGGEVLSSGAAAVLQQQQGMQGQQQLALHVGIAKVTLVAKEKGVRASMRDTHASMAPASLVPTLYDAIDTSDPSKHKLPGIAASTKPGKDSKTSSGKGTTSAVDSSRGGVLVVNETAAGYDLTCPGGQYRLHLAHPAVRHLVQQLLDLRNRLQHLNRQVKELQQSQQQQQQLVAAVSSQVAPRSRRVTRTDAPEERKSAGGTAGSSAAPSRRVTGTISTAGLAVPAAPGAPVSHPSTAAPSRQQKRKMLSCPVDIPAIYDVRLDGKLVKLEVLLEQQPWYKPPGPGMSSTNGIGNGAINADGAAAGARSSMDAGSRASTGGAPPSAKGKGKGRKHPKQLEFTVKSAAVLAGHEPHVMPQQLLQRVLQSMSDATVSYMWKLQLLELLLPDWLLTPQQAGELLGTFDRELAVEEKLSAAGLMWARLVQPADFWEHVLPAALKPMQQQRFKDLLGPQLMAFDRQNLTGSYTLNLGWSVHKAVAQRLQSAALQDNSTSECRYYICWRNVSLNGSPIREAATAQLQNFAMPSSGTLKLDYVGYQVPAPGCPPASADEMRWLLAGLRALQGAYYRVPLALRQEYLPGGLRRSQEEEKAAAARARTASKKLFAGRGAASNGHSKPADSSDPARAEDRLQQQQQELLLPSQQAPWWEANGLDPSALLLKYSARLSGSVLGRLSTSGALMTAQSLDKPSRPGTRDRSPSAASIKKRPSTAAGASRPSSATVVAAGESGAGVSRPSTAGTEATRPSAAGIAAADRSLGGSTVKSNRSSKAPRTSGPTASAAGAEAASSSLGSGVSNEEWLARLLATTAPHEAAAMFTRVGEAHAACLMQLLAALPAGPAAVAALVECLSPVVAVRFLADVPGHIGLLPAALRTQVEPLLKPTVAESIKQVSAAVAEAAATRTSQQLLLMRQFAAKASGISCSQLVEILKLLAAQGQGDRCAAIVALWSKVVDRTSLVEVFDGLSGSEQLGLMSALGSYHVWSTLAKPDGLHFRLDLTVPEQRDVAREVVKVAVRRSLSERAATGVRVQHLEQLTAEGKRVLDPEDDKLWLSLESKHTLLEFNFSRTWEQELRLMAGAVKRIQRAWRKRRLLRTESKAGTAISGPGGSSILRTMSWPMSNLSTLGGGPLGYDHLRGTGYKAGASGLSSELSLGFNSELTGTSSAMYTATTVSSLLSTPLSLSGYMSEVSGYISETPQQQQPGDKAGASCSGTSATSGPGERGKSSAGTNVDVATGLTLSQGGVGQAHDSAKQTPRLF